MSVAHRFGGEAPCLPRLPQADQQIRQRCAAPGLSFFKKRCMGRAGPQQRNAESTNMEPIRVFAMFGLFRVPLLKKRSTLIFPGLKKGLRHTAGDFSKVGPSARKYSTRRTDAFSPGLSVEQDPGSRPFGCPGPDSAAGRRESTCARELCEFLFFFGSWGSSFPKRNPEVEAFLFLPYFFFILLFFLKQYIYIYRGGCPLNSCWLPYALPLGESNRPISTDELGRAGAVAPPNLALVDMNKRPAFFFGGWF